ncbi:Fc receptor-like protein [Sarotherodon galilaeus]
MSSGHQSLYFLSLPDPKQLVCVTLTLQDEGEELRSKQIKTCRELVLLFSDLLAAPALDSFADITVVIATSFLQTGILQVFGHRHRLQLGSPQCVLPGDLQRCLSYSLISRLSPSWNKVGLFLVSGKDFLTESGRLSAVSVELSVTEAHMCFSIEASAVRLPLTTLGDFDLHPSVLRRLCSDPEFVLDLASTAGAVWCHVLPSMKKGQIIFISRQLPKHGPFRSYRDLQNHWNRMYGYRLPELAEDEVVYCSVYFRLLGEILFSYPLSCIRLQPVQRCPRVDLQGALGCFLSDVRHTLKTVCGFPAHLSSKPSYRAVSLSTAASVQVLNGLEINLTTSCSIKPVLTQLPPPPPPSQPLQPSAWTPVSQQEGAQELLEKGCGFRGRPTQSQGCGGGRDWPSSSSISSSHAAFSSSDSSDQESQPSCSSSSSSFLLHFQPASSLSSSSSSTSCSSLPVFQPASSFSSSHSSSSTPLSEAAVNPSPKLVPVFRRPSHHVTISLLRPQNQKKQLGGAVEGSERVTVPSFGKKIPATAPRLSYLSAASLPVLPLPIIPHFSRHPKLHSGTAAAHPPPAYITRISSLSPVIKFKPRIIIPPKPEIKSGSKTNPKVSSESDAVTGCRDETQTATETSKHSAKIVAFDLKAKKPRASVGDVDVENMVKTNQLSKLNSATLLLWLKARGVNVNAKHRKEELMMKVVGAGTSRLVSRFSSLCQSAAFVR